MIPGWSGAGGTGPFTLKFCAQNQCPPPGLPLSWLRQGHVGPGTRDLGPGARDSPGTEGGPEGRRCSTEGRDVWVHTPFPLECGAEPAPAGHALQGGHAPTGEERK